MLRFRTVVPALALGLTAACTVSSTTDRPADSGQAAATPAAGAAPTGAPASPTTVTGAGADSVRPAAPDTTAGAKSPDSRPVADVRLEVNTTTRQLAVFRGQTQTGTYGVAVGSAEWPTRTGEWRVTQVVWNPEWTPPDESWAEQREPREPGDPKNPLGRAQLIYDPPRTIHGTNEPQSIGKAVSHGSIRMRNEDITRLGRELMEATGAGKDEAWYRKAQTERTVKQVVDLPRVVPIRVY